MKHDGKEYTSKTRMFGVFSYMYRKFHIPESELLFLY